MGRRPEDISKENKRNNQQKIAINIELSKLYKSWASCGILIAQFRLFPLNVVDLFNI